MTPNVNVEAIKPLLLNSPRSTFRQKQIPVPGKGISAHPVTCDRNGGKQTAGEGNRRGRGRTGEGETRRGWRREGGVETEDWARRGRGRGWESVRRRGLTNIRAPEQRSVVLIKAALGTRGTRLTSAAAGIRSARGQRGSEQQGRRCPRRSCASCVPALDKWSWSSWSSVGTGRRRSAAGAEPTAWAQVPEGNAGSTAWEQVPEGSAVPTAGRCPCLSSPGWPNCSAAPVLRPGCTCGLLFLREVSKTPRAVPAVKESCVARSPRGLRVRETWTPAGGAAGPKTRDAGHRGHARVRAPAVPYAAAAEYGGGPGTCAAPGACRPADLAEVASWAGSGAEEIPHWRQQEAAAPWRVRLCLGP